MITRWKREPLHNSPRLFGVNTTALLDMFSDHEGVAPLSKEETHAILGLVTGIADPADSADLDLRYEIKRAGYMDPAELATQSMAMQRFIGLYAVQNHLRQEVINAAANSHVIL
jgi:hypothetical protein